MRRLGDKSLPPKNSGRWRRVVPNPLCVVRPFYLNGVRLPPNLDKAGLFVTLTDMNFAGQLASPAHHALHQLSIEANEADVASALGSSRPSLHDFARLISPAARLSLEQMARRSQALTQKNFGKTIRLFAPLYLSNECINSCLYCGFSRENPIARVTLSQEEVLIEAQALAGIGMRNLLLVAGEHPRFIPVDYLAGCVSAVRQAVPSVSLEVGPLDQSGYAKMVLSGAEGLVVYQETYQREIYAELHTAGPKKDFDWRLETPERAYAAGFRRLGIGALFGLADWRLEALAVAAHAEYLQKHCWRSQITISLPRLRPCAGDFQARSALEDRDLVQLICAFRCFLPEAGLVLSTREPASLRDRLIPLGITLMSAGSHTEPGGYTGAGQEKLHLTERGKIVPLPANASEWSPGNGATAQFEIADDRTPSSVAEAIRRLGYDPVWKDWDTVLSC